MIRRLYSLSALLILLLAQAGCSASILQLRDQPDLHRGTYRQKLTDKKELTAKFLACTRQAHDESLGERREGATGQNPLPLQSPDTQSASVRPLTALIEKIRQRHHDKAASLSILTHVLDDVANEVNARVDVDKLKEVIALTGQWHGHLGLDEEQLEQDASRFARTLLAYNKAYFGDLSFVASPNMTGAGLHGVAKITSKGFVDRSGNALLFPGISPDLEVGSTSSLRVSATRVDSQHVSADLTRIFLEAFFDSAFRVPAVHGATALRVGSNPQESPYPEFDANHPAIPLEALARVTRDALRAEAAVTSLVGKAVRGGTVFGTQNETLAATLETAAGVIAKKLVEHEGFCYFQVTQGL